MTLNIDAEAEAALRARAEFLGIADVDGYASGGLLKWVEAENEAEAQSQKIFEDSGLAARIAEEMKDPSKFVRRPLPRRRP